MRRCALSRLAPVSFLLLVACGGVSQSEVDHALVEAWTSDSARMAQQAGVSLPGSEPGALHGMVSSAQAAQQVASEYGGDAVGGVVGAAVSGAAKVASDFGIEGAAEVHKSIGIATATDWKVRNLEILSERESGDEYVVQVRYDLGATVNGSQETLAKDVTHQVRLIDGDKGWMIEHSQ